MQPLLLKNRRSSSHDCLRYDTLFNYNTLWDIKYTKYEKLRISDTKGIASKISNVFKAYTYYW
jgi:hypothetical protein